MAEDTEDTEDSTGGVPSDLVFENQRFIEKYYPLYMVANEGRRNIVAYANKMYQLEQFAEESSVEAEVVQAINKCHDLMNNGVVKASDITQMFNSQHNEKERWKTQTVSGIVKRLGFQQKRASDGKTGYIWNEDILIKLNKRYNIQDSEDTPLPPPSSSSSVSSEASQTIDSLFAGSHLTLGLAS